MIQVICGPMFSGKSIELITRVAKAEIAGLNPIIIKHSLDDRWSTNKIVARIGLNKNCLLAPNVKVLDDIISQNDSKFIAIDEIQFFDKSIVKLLKKYKDKDFLLCGLDLDWKGDDFGCMGAVLAYADEVLKIKSVCTNIINGNICGANASKTKRLTASEAIVDIGDTDKYEARCNHCWTLN
jgi:thymidine kinase